MKPYRFIISGGGTGGHIYPAIAIANALKAKYPNAEFLFVGAKDRMEMQKVPKAGYSIKGLWISGIQRSLSAKNLMFPLKLVSSLIESGKILRQFKPHVAIGTGGFASAPLLKVASNRGIPCLIQEQNSHAGITNKWLAKKVKTICVAYQGMEQFFPKEKLVLTGNPVRQDLIVLTTNRADSIAHFGLDPNKKTLLVLGGSLGAGKINSLIKDHLDFIQDSDLQLLWQCGSYYFEQYKALNSPGVVVTDFIYKMDAAYTAADFIISRAGALSVSELCLIGKPVIFIPSPNVAEDHQTKNAKAIAVNNACIYLAESQAPAEFKSELTELINNKARQKQLGENMKQLAEPDATNKIVAQVELLLNATV